jgi:hypothetical protein
MILPTMLRKIAIALLYLATALAVTLVWTVLARTERVLSEPGEPVRRGITSLLLQIDGTGRAPFLWRRLLPDLTPPLARAVPAGIWASFTDFVRGESRLGRLLRRLLDYLGWPVERYPEMVTALFLMVLCLLGFLMTARWLVHQQYHSPPWLAHAIALVAGVLVLGGCDVAWGSYPYDIPNLFVFTLALAGILGSRWWMLPVFAAAVWSKETSVLLIGAFAVVHRGQWRRWSAWVQLVVMGVLFLTIRWWIGQRFPVEGAEQWWFPERNLKVVLSRAVFGLWWIVPGLIVLTRIVHMRRQMPRHLLLLLAAMAGVMVGAAFFKGWIEERRQYLELLPLAVLVGCRWAVVELGAGSLLIARVCADGEQEKPDSAWSRT